jgi:ribosomal protein L39E
VFRREEITWEYLQGNVDQSAMFHFPHEILPSRVRPKSLAHLHRSIAQALKQETQVPAWITVRMGSLPVVRDPTVAISEAERQRRQAAKGKINPYRKKTYYTSTYRRY